MPFDCEVGAVEEVSKEEEAEEVPPMKGDMVGVVMFWVGR